MGADGSVGSNQVIRRISSAARAAYASAIAGGVAAIARGVAGIALGLRRSSSGCVPVDTIGPHGRWYHSVQNDSGSVCALMIGFQKSHLCSVEKPNRLVIPGTSD